MNRNHNLIIDFRINGKHDHVINKKKHTQPHQKKRFATNVSTPARLASSSISSQL